MVVILVVPELRKEKGKEGGGESLPALVRLCTEAADVCLQESPAGFTEGVAGG